MRRFVFFLSFFVLSSNLEAFDFYNHADPFEVIRSLQTRVSAYMPEDPETKEIVKTVGGVFLFAGALGTLWALDFWYKPNCCPGDTGNSTCDFLHNDFPLQYVCNYSEHAYRPFFDACYEQGGTLLSCAWKLWKG